jgi:DNA-binding response OmpR family regulator
MNRILIGDDDLGLCELRAEYFGSEGYQTEVVHNGEDTMTLGHTFRCFSFPGQNRQTGATQYVDG